MGGDSLDYTMGMFYPRLAAIVSIDLTDGDFWWVGTQPFKRKKKSLWVVLGKHQPFLKLSTSEMASHRCPSHEGAGTFGSTGFMLNFVTKNWTGLQKAYSPPGTCFVVVLQCFWQSPHSSVALLEVQVSQNGPGTAGGRVTFRTGSSS